MLSLSLKAKAKAILTLNLNALKKQRIHSKVQYNFKKYYHLSKAQVKVIFLPFMWFMELKAKLNDIKSCFSNQFCLHIP